MKKLKKSIFFAACLLSAGGIILGKTHLAFGGDFFSQRNLYITIGLLVVVITILGIAHFLDKKVNDSLGTDDNN